MQFPKKIYLSVIIPAYNEANRLSQTLYLLNDYLTKKDYLYEIIVVNDGSTDNTSTVVRNLSKKIFNLKLIDNRKNKGKGAAVRQGILSAKGEYRLFMDADDSTSIEYFTKMVPYFKSSYDVVIASRGVKGAILDPRQSLIRELLGKLGNIIIQIVLLPGITDTQCGFKCFSSGAAKQIFRFQRVNGWGFDIEVLSLAKKLGFNIKEIPVVWKNAKGSKVKWSSYLSVLLEVFKIRVWLWLHYYNIN